MFSDALAFSTPNFHLVGGGGGDFDAFTSSTTTSTSDGGGRIAESWSATAVANEFVQQFMQSDDHNIGMFMF